MRCNVDHAIVERWQEPSSAINWTEFLYFFAYDAEIGCGINIHIGREVGNLDIWRALYTIYLPGGELLVGKSFGRAINGNMLALGGLNITSVIPGDLWILSFEGAGQRVSRRSNLTEPHRDRPDETFSYQLAFRGRAPCWDHRASLGDSEFYARMHFEQICQVDGLFDVGGEQKAFSGVGVRDHSAGSRDYAELHGDFWLCAAFPDNRALMLQVIHMEGTKSSTGYVYWGDGDELETVIPISHPAIPAPEMSEKIPADLMLSASTRAFRAEFDTSRGRQHVDVELLHSGGGTFLSPSSELLGTHMDRPDGKQWCEYVAKVRWDDQTGYGLRERIAPIKVLQI